MSNCLRVQLPVQLNSSCQLEICLDLEPKFAASNFSSIYEFEAAPLIFTVIDE